MTALHPKPEKEASLSLALNWRDVIVDQTERHARRERERWVLRTVARLPFVSESILEELARLRRGSLARVLTRHIAMGLLATIAAPIAPGHTPRLLYATDLGIAALIALNEVNPNADAKYMDNPRRHLLRLVPTLPLLQDAYRLLAAVAASESIPVEVRRWTWPHQPRHRRYRGIPTDIGASALAKLAWDRHELCCLLVPDRGELPLRAYWNLLDALHADQQRHRARLPLVVVATPPGPREIAWRSALPRGSSRDGHGLDTVFARWTDLAATVRPVHGFIRLRDATVDSALTQPSAVRTVRSQARSPRRIIGPASAVAGGASPAAAQLAHTALQLAPSDRALLQIVGQHPLLMDHQLAVLLNRGVRALRWQRRRLIALGLIHLIKADHAALRGRVESVQGAGKRPPELTELSKLGRSLIARQWGIPASGAVHLRVLYKSQWLGSVRDGSRRQLVLANIVEANCIAVRLVSALRQLGESLQGGSTVIWRRAAASTRAAPHAHSYIGVEVGPRALGFLLEFDRGVRSGRDYRKKFAAYTRYAETGRLADDYQGPLVVLVVTTGPGAEERIAKAICAVSTKSAPLAFRLTTTGWIQGHDQGVMGPIWRTPVRTEQRRCLIEPSL
jgi:hypothetical protein